MYYFKLINPHSSNCGFNLIILPMLSLDDVRTLIRLVLLKGCSAEPVELPHEVIDGDLTDGEKDGNSMFLAINNFLTYASAST